MNTPFASVRGHTDTSKNGATMREVENLIPNRLEYRDKKGGTPNGESEQGNSMCLDRLTAGAAGGKVP
jgi:hypothetical protein